MNSGTNLKHLTENLDKNLARIRMANISLSMGNLPSPSAYFYDAHKALKELEHELRRVRVYISKSEMKHREV